MANSVKPGPAGTHHRHRRHHAHTAAVPPKPRVPPRTPGPMGRNDQGDPSLTSLLGWTPNVTGLHDWVDETLREAQTWWNRTVGGFGRDASTGEPVAVGRAPVAPPAAGQLSLAEAQLMALKITTVFEGQGSLNYKALADNFDGMGMSFGLVQWNFGMGTLGKLLNKMRAQDAATFDGCFDPGANYAVLKAALAAKDKQAQMQWAIGLEATPAGRKAWKASFHALGSVEAFNKIQLDTAVNDYQPTVLNDIAFLRELNPAAMREVEFRSYASLFDCAIQQGGLKKAKDEIRAKVASDKPATQLALLKIAVTERANKASHASVADCLSRRLSILEGKALEFSAYGKTYKRANPQYALVASDGSKIVAGV
jgi:hypothetical protein